MKVFHPHLRAKCILRMHIFSSHLHIYARFFSFGKKCASHHKVDAAPYTLLRAKRIRRSVHFFLRMRFARKSAYMRIRRKKNEKKEALCTTKWPRLQRKKEADGCAFFLRKKKRIKVHKSRCKEQNCI